MRIMGKKEKVDVFCKLKFDSGKVSVDVPAFNLLDYYAIRVHAAVHSKRMEEMGLSVIGTFLTSFITVNNRDTFIASKDIAALRVSMDYIGISANIARENEYIEQDEVHEWDVFFNRGEGGEGPIVEQLLFNKRTDNEESIFRISLRIEGKRNVDE